MRIIHAAFDLRTSLSRDLQAPRLSPLTTSLNSGHEGYAADRDYTDAV